MKYLSLDIETTSLIADPSHILQVSMVVENTKECTQVEDLPHFTCFVRQSEIKGQAYALSMNGWILDILSGRSKEPTCLYPILSANPHDDNYWVQEALDFLGEHFGDKRITVAGKNVAGFDIPFLPFPLRRRFGHRVLDPGTLYVDWSIDTQVPTFELCKERAALPDITVKHDAREDAMDVIRLLRRFYI